MGVVPQLRNCEILLSLVSAGEALRLSPRLLVRVDNG